MSRPRGALVGAARARGQVRSTVAAAVATAVGALAVLSGCSAEGDPSSTAGPATKITVAAASDLRGAFDELTETFEARSGVGVTVSYGSSGQLKEQILNGAPFDVFASADVGFVDEVIAAGRADGSTEQVYGVGRLVVFSALDSPDAPTTLEDLTVREIRQVAIANPAHAPYGRAAEQALRAAGVHDAVAPKVVLGQNVSDALRLATTGNADAAVVALSLVATSDSGSWTLVDDALHDPLVQSLVATGVDPSTAEAARSFVAHVTSARGREVLGRYGFEQPERDGR